MLKEEKNKISELTKITFKNNDKTKMSLNQNNKTMGGKKHYNKLLRLKKSNQKTHMERCKDKEFKIEEVHRWVSK